MSFTNSGSLSYVGYNGFDWWVIIKENVSKHLQKRLTHTSYNIIHLYTVDHNVRNSHCLIEKLKLNITAIMMFQSFTRGQISNFWWNNNWSLSWAYRLTVEKCFKLFFFFKIAWLIKHFVNSENLSTTATVPNNKCLKAIFQTYRIYMFQYHFHFPFRFMWTNGTAKDDVWVLFLGM